MKLKIALIRHGEPENSEDGPLSENGKKTVQEKSAAKEYPALKHVYTCDLMCCRDTALLIYPFPAVVLKELSMTGPVNMDTLYSVSVKAGSIIRKIGAEMEIKNAEQCALISCKMVLLELLRRYCVPRSSYEDWQLPFGGGYLVEYDTDGETARILREI